MTRTRLKASKVLLTHDALATIRRLGVLPRSLTQFAITKPRPEAVWVRQGLPTGGSTGAFVRPSSVSPVLVAGPVYARFGCNRMPQLDVLGPLPI